MRIAIPVVGNEVSPSFGGCEAFRFYEDDHGRIVRQYRAEVTAEGALAVLERYGVDAVVCGALDAEEKSMLAASGLLLSTDYEGDADAAALRYLGGAIAFDPANTCDYCGHKHECSMDCQSENA
ncbi:MAG: hypothetical protein E7425_05415 [Ruminococcaceae bacterium]|nr:hypothetical protein [Oscillospiraceae bacterium]